MPSLVVVGTQWGDEGKGKYVDLLSERMQVVVRYGGGHNAGHTVVVGKDQFVLHIIPSGILHPGVVCVIGNGCVVDPDAFLAEVEKLGKQGIQLGNNLLLSDRAQLILSYHRLQEAREEERLGARRIGTTCRGIGPAYEDKIARRAVRVSDLFHRERFAARLGEVLDYHNFLLREYYKADTVDFQKVLDETLLQAERVRPLVTDVTLALERIQRDGGNILFEGAQGALLDIDQGTYPYVTSSNTSAGSAAAGTGLGPRDIDEVLGIVKAYTTRVGGGPFPTELFDGVGEHLSRVGHEFGAVTGRRRRCGWFDAVALRRAVINSSVSGLCVMKLDVLDGLDTVRVCTAYRVGGKTVECSPAVPEAFAESEPVYEEWPGWSESTVGVTDYEQLPKAARRYLERLAELVGVPMDIVSTGPDRAQTIVLRHPFD